MKWLRRHLREQVWYKRCEREYDDRQKHRDEHLNPSLVIRSLTNMESRRTSSILIYVALFLFLPLSYVFKLDAEGVHGVGIGTDDVFTADDGPVNHTHYELAKQNRTRVPRTGNSLTCSQASTWNGAPQLETG